MLATLFVDQTKPALHLYSDGGTMPNKLPAGMDRTDHPSLPHDPFIACRPFLSRLVFPQARSSGPQVTRTLRAVQSIGADSLFGSLA